MHTQHNLLHFLKMYYATKIYCSWQYYSTLFKRLFAHLRSISVNGIKFNFSSRFLNDKTCCKPYSDKLLLFCFQFNYAKIVFIANSKNLLQQSKKIPWISFKIVFREQLNCSCKLCDVWDTTKTVIFPRLCEISVHPCPIFLP